MEGKKYLIYISLITVLVLISSCAQVQDKDTKDTIIDASFGAISTYLGAEFELKVNQEAVINSENIRIKFLEILEDSRCPRDVQCIWAGQIKILINIMKNNQDMGNFELAINPVKGDTLNFSGIEGNASYRVFNLLGQQIADGDTDNNSINVGALLTGIYILQVSDGTSVGTKRFIKE